jgi:polysaccharide biosynthesis transport protein
MLPKPATSPHIAYSSWKNASKLFLDAWKVLRKRWVWVVTIAVSVVAAAVFYTAGQQRIYLSSCVIQIDPKPPKPLGQAVQAIVDVGTNSFCANAEYYKTQLQIMQVFFEAT